MPTFWNCLRTLNKNVLTEKQFLLKCRICWDLGIKSPNGYNNNTNDQELGFEEFYYDFLNFNSEFVESIDINIIEN